MISQLKRFAKKHIQPSSPLYSMVQGVYLRIKEARLTMSKSSIFNDEDQLEWCSLFPQDVLDLTLRTFQPKSVLDVGCGVGRSLDYFVEQGVDAWGMEGSALAIRKARHPDRIQQKDLNVVVELPRKFDLVWSYEVAEHIHPDYVENFLQTITRHADHVVISAARPGQGGDGHFNEQPPEYWIEKFARYGFTVNRAFTEAAHTCQSPYSENILGFDRTPAPASAA